MLYGLVRCDQVTPVGEGGGQRHLNQMVIDRAGQARKQEARHRPQQHSTQDLLAEQLHDAQRVGLARVSPC